MADSTLTRRDMLLIGTGIAVLFIGKIADSSINGFAVGDEVALNAAVQRLNGIPTEIGHWVSTSSELSEREIEVAGIRGYVRREYRNPKTGYTVNLTLLCGQSGPMSVHPPTACFQGVGYTLISGPTVKGIDQEGSIRSELNTSSFRQGNTSVPEIVRVFWGWGTDGTWAAPSNPRFEFRGQTYLYKLYVTDRWLEDTGRQSLPQIETFMEDALPVIASVLQQ